MKSKVLESVYGCNFGLLSICVVRVKYWGDRYIINILISVLLVPNGTQIFRILFPKNILPDKAFTSSILSRWLGVTSIICRFLKWDRHDTIHFLSTDELVLSAAFSNEYVRWWMHWMLYLPNNWVLNYLPVREEIYKLFLGSHNEVKNRSWLCLVLSSL